MSNGSLLPGHIGSGSVVEAIEALGKTIEALGDRLDSKLEEIRKEISSMREESDQNLKEIRAELAEANRLSGSRPLRQVK